MDRDILLKGASRVILQIVLFLIFIFYFGLPSVAKYQKKNVMMVNNVINTNGIPIPAISVVVLDNATRYESCLFKNTSLVERCIDESAKNWTQIISSVVLGLTRKKIVDLTNGKMEEGFTHVLSPSILTLKLPYRIGPNDRDDQLFILLDPKYNGQYEIFVHDPEVFLLNVNPSVEPILRRRELSGLFYSLELTEIVEIDVPMDPCNPDVGYSFRQCIKRSVTSQVK